MLLADAVPGSAIVARTGGEEFVVLLPDTALSTALLVASLARSRLAEADLGDLPTFTFSAGVAQRQAGESFIALKRRADLATYRAKAAGRDRVEAEPSRDMALHSASVVRLDAARQR
ncbi:diguanylate cyclase [Sphingopyxis sp.]|uniref:diguanylate cyclase n=1 Tax=Sphingopyxis sp. TaxID=1908224 RepID=UPI003BAD3EA4